MFHLSYGMVELPLGKMKSRDGNVVDADDLVALMVETSRQRTQELGKISDFTSEEAEKLYHLMGVGAIKYFLLKVDPQKTMLFIPEDSIDMQGNTATFIQYTHARIRSIVRKGIEMGIDFNSFEEFPTSFRNSEGDVIRLLYDYPTKVLEAAQSYSPAVIANYVYDLAKTYNTFFADCSIFKAETPQLLQFRVLLSNVVGRTIKHGFSLLGIDVPERM
jgi:arginyl-tRNA synthetase